MVNLEYLDECIATRNDAFGSLSSLIGGDYRSLLIHTECFAAVVVAVADFGFVETTTTTTTTIAANNE